MQGVSRGPLSGTEEACRPAGRSLWHADHQPAGETLATWFHTTPCWVTQGMTGGCRAVRRLTGSEWVSVTLDSAASRVGSSTATPRCKANRLPRSVPGVSRCSTIRARGRPSAENPLGTDFSQRASWIHLAGITASSPLHHRIQSCSDTLGQPCGIVSDMTQSKRDRTLRSVGGS